MRTRAELRDALAAAPRPVGLVPTMGWLHEGHRALMQRAREDNATVVVSIFVNPRQFNVASDFTRYPRNEARDLAMCEAEGVDLVFAPEVEEVYPPGFATTVSVGAVALPLEGAARPGHFDGVATVVAILFDLVGAERAYFGQKDAQQVMVIRQMARDLAIGTEVVTCPTVREPDGLALSSRNVHLSPDERAGAPVLRRALLAARARMGGGRAVGGCAACADARPAGRGTARRRGVCVGRGRPDARRARHHRRSGTGVAGRSIRNDPLIDNESSTRRPERDRQLSGVQAVTTSIAHPEASLDDSHLHPGVADRRGDRSWRCPSPREGRRRRRRLDDRIPTNPDAGDGRRDRVHHVGSGAAGGKCRTTPTRSRCGSSDQRGAVVESSCRPRRRRAITPRR